MFKRYILTIPRCIKEIFLCRQINEQSRRQNKIRAKASTLKYIRSVKIIYQNIKLLAVKDRDLKNSRGTSLLMTTKRGRISITPRSSSAFELFKAVNERKRE